MGADEIIPVITIVNSTGQQFVCMGNTVIFSVDAVISNSGRFRYQWQRNGVNIPDSTGRTLTIYNSNFDSEAFYRVILMGNSGADTVVSQMMQLAIAPQTKVFIQPKTVYLLPGSNATFEVGAEAAQHGKPPRDLFRQGADVRRQHAVQVKGVALLIGERRALVEQGLIDQVDSGQTGFDDIVSIRL